jgi:hypothetical protein
MKIYLGLSPDDPRNYKNFERVLISYHYFKKKYDEIGDLIKDYDLFVDSGAFSAFTQSKAIDLTDYMNWITSNKFTTYASLDVIYDPAQTMQNLRIMESNGLKPIPTFHYGSDLTILEALNDEYSYIAFGGLVPLAKDKRRLMEWLDNCFAIVIDNIRSGKIKIHGFGVLADDMLKRYPFYSVDGTSWIQGGKFGETVQYKDGKLRRQSNAVTEARRLKRDYKEMNMLAIEEYKKLERFMTNLWAERGIIYE